MNIQSLKNRLGLGALIAASTFTGAVGGVTLFNAVAAHAQAAPTVVTAQTAAPTVSPSPGTNQGQSKGTFHSNEDPAHEAKESPEREAQENSGQAPWQHQSVNGVQ